MTTKHAKDCNVRLGFSKGEICSCHAKAQPQPPHRHGEKPKMVPKSWLDDGVPPNAVKPGEISETNTTTTTERNKE